MSSDLNPIEPITKTADTATGWSHLGKTALPLIGQVGAVIGGVFSMLAVFEKISGEIVTTVEGFILVAAIIASGIVVFYRQSIIVDEQKKNVYLYPRKARIIAAMVMTIAGILLAVFILRLWVTANGGSIRAPFSGGGRQTPFAGLTRNADRADKIPPTFTPSTPTRATNSTAVPTTLATNTPSLTPPPPKTATATTATTPPIDQITDVSLLIKMGNDALTAKRYSQAQNYFTRATFVEATNAQAQFGLGQAQFYQNNFNSALEPFQIALRLNANLFAAHAYLGWIYDYRQDKARAVAEYDVFLKAAPRDDPLRPDISDRMKQLINTSIAPTLTPNATPAATATPTITK